ncbi:sugar transferase [Macrococcoides caseolyticum]|uniref:sugar transferase n=1 Tax=Macrococcoides caseolyticum TaxID=69966 RepID=UPI000C346FD2|nr:sugar transferase [Macrococcus caseolyticus]PKE18223.1 sugar transferase [Macrococcus caseolyticus]PKE68519.1 sugar transferase [Macrococcus caseolyticus]
MKRTFDILFSLLFLILFSPLMVIISLFIFLEDKNNPFFLQTRGGLKGRHFRIIKFRTMKVNAENMGAKYKVSKNDNRITKTGKVLRTTSLDELPQFINVLKGDMSVVGPRPALTVQTDKYTEQEKQRLDVRPGITGLAQVSGRNNLTWDQKIKIDIEYVNNRSLILDFYIIFLTILKIFKPDNIYTKE